MMRFEGTIKTKRELTHTQPIPISLVNTKARAVEQTKALTGASLEVLERTSRPDREEGPEVERYGYLCYAKTESGNEFLWDIDGRDVESFRPYPKQGASFEAYMELIRVMAQMGKA